MWGRVPIGIFITLAILVLLSYLYNYHTFGQYVKAIGGNEKASSLAGVNVDKQRFYTFLLMGIVVGFTAILYIGRMGSYKADYGTTYELFTIAAVTIGGTALYGGKGRVWGAYFGALIFAIVTRAIIYLGIGFRWQQVFTGLLILIGVTMYYAPLGREEEGIPG